MFNRYLNKHEKDNYKFFVYLVISLPVIFLSSCINTAIDSQYSPHPVVTIDKIQAIEMKCTFLYKTNNKETGWNYASATANTLKILKDKLFGFFVGQVMKETQGKANPKSVNEILRKILDKS